MKQLEKIKPITTKVTGHRVIVSDKVFSELIAVINKQTEVINNLIDNQESNHNDIVSLDASLKDLAIAIKAL